IEGGFELIDCQVDSAHLRSLGARLIARAEFQGYLKKWCKERRPWNPENK
ncbi:MAG: leucyl/phenylalanyl-tRNA--protein transferase, partial [Bacteroidetes bacterium]